MSGRLSRASRAWRMSVCHVPVQSPGSCASHRRSLKNEAWSEDEVEKISEFF